MAERGRSAQNDAYPTSPCDRQLVRRVEPASGISEALFMMRPGSGLAAALFLAASTAGAETPGLQPGFDIGFFDMIPESFEHQDRLQNRFTLSFDLKLGIGQHFLLSAGYLAPTGNLMLPDNKLLSIKLDFLFIEGNLTPYVGAGLGYLWQQLLFEFDLGTRGEGSGAAVLFEAGVMLKRWPDYGSVSVCVQYVLPTFSVSYPFFVASGSVTAPFLLVGLKAGL
jgi:hypothetical protein